MIKNFVLPIVHLSLYFLTHTIGTTANLAATLWYSACAIFNKTAAIILHELEWHLAVMQFKLDIFKEWNIEENLQFHDYYASICSQKGDSYLKLAKIEWDNTYNCNYQNQVTFNGVTLFYSLVIGLGIFKLIKIPLQFVLQIELVEDLSNNETEEVRNNLTEAEIHQRYYEMEHNGANQDFEGT
jgi:hypothetical protein